MADDPDIAAVLDLLHQARERRGWTPGDLGARLEGLVLDPVYSGKGLAGLIAMVQSGRWTKDHDVVFVHTGGAPALFAYRRALPV